MGSLEPESAPMPEFNDSGCVQDCSESYKGQTELLDLSDDVLLYIMKLCSPRDLKALGHTCHRLGILICDRTLWQKVDARAVPTGQERLRWLLTHCLSPVTQELKLSGYVDKESNCLGIQDLSWPLSGDSAIRRVGSGPDMEHFLLRMWYSHLPRYALSPRWPDKREAAGKAYSRTPEGPKQPLSPLSQLASEIVAGASTSSSPSTVSDMTNSEPNSSNSDLNSSSGSDIHSSETKNDVIASGCHGPQFTLNHSLLKTLRSKCQNLSSLTLEYCNLDYRNANIRYFPPNLKKLSLKGTRCYNLPLNTSYLGKIQDRLPELEYLDISECEWFEPASLMPLSKVKNLQELYMRECRRLTECVAYASLATRYGFQKLRILDVRGSPVADSELSSFGWLRNLEELYASPADNFKMSGEHTHKWEDVLAPFTELDSWEAEEPDYYKCKTPPMEFTEEDEDPKEDGEGTSEMRVGDVMLGNYITCASLERRIIVIHPNRQNQNENQQNDQRVEPPPDPEPEVELGPVPDPPQDPVPQPGPSRNLKRPYPCKVLNLAKKRFHEEGTNSEDDQERSDERPSGSEPMKTNSEDDQEKSEEISSVSEPMKTSSEDNQERSDGQPSVSEPMNTNSEDQASSSDRPSVPEPVNCTPHPESRSPKPSTSDLVATTSTSESASKSSDPKPCNSKTDDSVPSCSTPIPGLSKRFHRDGLDANIDLSQPMGIRINPRIYPDPREGRESFRPHNIRYYCRKTDAATLENARPPVAVHARPINARPSNERPTYGFIFDCPDVPRVGPVRRHGDHGHRARRFDFNIHQENITIPREFRQLGFNLVSDSTVLRFGRAENDNINYINLGNHFNANDPGVRPDRSNLRVLSLTGYINITDRSLQHLATAAPHLRHIDFSYSTVSPRGVAFFKAIQPNCEVVFSNFHDGVL
ncbi:unnamed protein product [Arctia plantaginis]|uniref:F-box domain-containing protein n=1 Tax=Arctia plantaginis TaxID=874455 RepID=A0A8S1BII6_ARCPL|nr:unnamed protein product [Arctia plantaginis]